MPIIEKEYLKDFSEMYAILAGTSLATLGIGYALERPWEGYIIGGALLVPMLTLLISGHMSTRIEDVYVNRFKKEMKKIIKETEVAPKE